MKLGDLGHVIVSTGTSAMSVFRSAVAAATGALLLFNEMKRSARAKVDSIRSREPEPTKPTKKSSEVITMKKSTVIALFAALAAVAGVLGALYVYVLRREKELDEYEQLLFSEDFDDDDLTDEEIEAILAVADEGEAEEEAAE